MGMKDNFTKSVCNLFFRLFEKGFQCNALDQDVLSSLVNAYQIAKLWIEECKISFI